MKTYLGENLLESDCDVIIHCCNCFNTMGAGIAKAIADKYKGVIKDPKIHESLLADFRLWCMENGFGILGETESPIKGASGNIEFLFHIKIKNEI